MAYSRAIRVENHVWVSGTTASDEAGNVVAPGDAGEQTRFILSKIEHALGQVGARLRDVVRTRMFVTDISQWQEIGAAHAEAFTGVEPVATMVEVSRLVSPEQLVEIEVDAVVDSASDE